MRKFAGLRVTNGLKQSDVAKKMGISQGTVSLWERGEANPTLDKIPLLAKLYGVTEQEILTACITASPNSIISQEGADENVR